MKLQQTKNEQYIITLPKQVVIALGWNKGDSLTFKLENRKLVLSKENTKDYPSSNDKSLL